METISRRDYIAIHASEEEINRLMPKNLGDTADMLVERGIVRPYDKKYGDITRVFDRHHVKKLRMMIRYEYADAMIKMADQTLQE